MGNKTVTKTIPNSFGGLFLSPGVILCHLGVVLSLFGGGRFILPKGRGEVLVLVATEGG